MAEAEVVRMAFRWLIDEQLSTYQINKRLNELGVRTRRGKERWCGGTIINLLRNPVYTGAYYYNKRQYVPAKRRNMPGDAPPYLWPPPPLYLLTRSRDNQEPCFAEPGYPSIIVGTRGGLLLSRRGMK